MEVLTLLKDADAAGLSVVVEDDRLVIRGPKRAEPVVRRLAAHKSEVIQVLQDGWCDCAHRLLVTCPNADLRSDLTDFYQETSVWLEYVQDLDRQAAERQAFGILLCEILNRSLGKGPEIAERT